MTKEDFKKFDHLIFGIILGIITPYLVMSFWVEQYSSFSLNTIILDVFGGGKVSEIQAYINSEILNVLKSGLFVNLGVFFLFYWLKKDKSARGVVFATFLYGAIYLFYMFFS